MVSTRNPETMTEPERRREIVGILARALLRRIDAAKLAQSSPDKTILKAPQSALISGRN